MAGVGDSGAEDTERRKESPLSLSSLRRDEEREEELLPPTCTSTLLLHLCVRISFLLHPKRPKISSWLPLSMDRDRHGKDDSEGRKSERRATEEEMTKERNRE